MSIIGLHFADQVYSEAQRTRWLAHIRDIKPRFVVVLVGAQRKEATWFVLDILRQCPHTSVIIRHYADGGDDGMWRRMAPDDYINRIGGLYKAQLAGFDNWYLMPDNEFSSDDQRVIDAWLAWQYAVAEHAHTAGIKLALGCQPTHNPAPHQIEAGWYDPLWAMFKKYSEHVYYRNIYYSADNKDGLRYLTRIVNQMKKAAAYVPQIVIGEFARLRDIHEAQHGYKTIAGVTRTGLALEAVGLYRTYMQGLSPFGVYACWYCVGDWPASRDTFNIADDDTFFKVLSDVAHEKLPDTAPLPPPEPDPVIVTPIPTIEPDDDTPTVIVKPVVAIDRDIAQTQLVSCREIMRSVRQQMEIVSSQLQADESQLAMLQTQVELNREHLKALDKSANQLQALILVLELALEGNDKAADVAA